jgi:hypothetical protein
MLKELFIIQRDEESTKDFFEFYGSPSSSPTRGGGLSKKRKSNLIESILSTIVGYFALSGLIICYIEQWWIIYGIIVAIIMIAGVSNYVVNYKKQ